MRLAGKRLLMLVMDGVNLEDFEKLKAGFIDENAEIYLSTPQDYLTVETTSNGRRGKDILVDMPFEAIPFTRFDGLIIPSGMLSVDLLRHNKEILKLIKSFYSLKLPIFACKEAISILKDCDIIPSNILVQDELAPMESFLERAIHMMIESSTFRKVAA